MTTPHDAPRTLTARTPEDLLAMVPYILGFRPDQSVVMLTFGAAGLGFHARADLPDDPERLGDLVDLLLEPVLRHGVERVVAVGYGDDPELCDQALALLGSAMLAEGVEVVELLRVHEHRWVSLLGPHPPGGPGAGAGVEFDDRTHPFTLQGVLEGRVILDSRDDLADSLVGRDSEAVEAVAAAVEVWSGRRDVGDPHHRADRWIEAQWVQDTVARLVADVEMPTVDETGRLLVAFADRSLRDVAWGLMCRETAETHIGLWRWVLHRTPSTMQAAPATLLGFAAWLAGHGALAWCAVDRAVLADPDYSMATLLSDTLEQAVPPTVWEPMTDISGLLRGA